MSRGIEVCGFDGRDDAAVGPGIVPLGGTPSIGHDFSVLCSAGSNDAARAHAEGEDTPAFDLGHERVGRGWQVPGGGGFLTGEPILSAVHPSLRMLDADPEGKGLALDGEMRLRHPLEHIPRSMACGEHNSVS